MGRYSSNSHYAVRNINGSSKNKCNCRSWIAHWRYASQSDRGTCAVVPCSNPAQVGAHVRIVDESNEQSWWIVPFCRTHNHFSKTEPMYIDCRTVLISANVRVTCHRGNWSYDDE
jgi:hypothetical protein